MTTPIFPVLDDEAAVPVDVLLEEPPLPEEVELEDEAKPDPEVDGDGEMVVAPELDEEGSVAEELVIMAVDGDEEVDAAVYVVEETPEEPVALKPEM